MRDAVIATAGAAVQPAFGGWLRARRRSAGDDFAEEPLLTARERAALQHGSWFAALPLLARHDLLRRCSVRRYPRGGTVHMDGAGCTRLDAVASGAVAIAMRETPLDAVHYLPAGSWLVDPAMFTGGERRHSVVALPRTTIVSVRAPELADAMAAHPGLELALLRMSHERVAEQAEILDELSALDLRTRIARCLRRLCVRFGEAEPRGTRIALELKQDALAVLVRASRARVNLHLKAMERAGVVLVERQIVVRDLALLAEFC